MSQQTQFCGGGCVRQDKWSSRNLSILGRLLLYKFVHMSKRSYTIKHRNIIHFKEVNCFYFFECVEMFAIINTFNTLPTYYPIIYVDVYIMMLNTLKSHSNTQCLFSKLTKLWRLPPSYSYPILIPFSCFFFFSRQNKPEIQILTVTIALNMPEKLICVQFILL